MIMLEYYAAVEVTSLLPSLVCPILFNKSCKYQHRSRYKFWFLFNGCTETSTIKEIAKEVLPLRIERKG